MQNRVIAIEAQLLKRRRGASKTDAPAAARQLSRAANAAPIRVALSLSTLTGKAVDKAALNARFPSGVAFALWNADSSYFKTRGDLWSAAEDGIGAKGDVLDGSKLLFGQSVKGESALTVVIPKLTAALEAVCGGASASTKVRTLALFTHGWEGGVGIAGGIRTKDLPTLMTKLAPHFSDDVKIILFGCSVCRGVSEAEGWKTTTFNDAGADSFAGAMRDALLAAGLKTASVWGHTEVGDTVDNFTLREFRAVDGKGANGRSFLKHYAVAWDTTVVDDLEKKMQDGGYTIDAANRAEFVKHAKDAIREAVYGVYLRANEKLKLDGRNIAEAAPTRPTEVGALVSAEWTKAFAADWEDMAKKVAKKAKLTKAATTKSFSTATDRPWAHFFPFAAGSVVEAVGPGGRAGHVAVKKASAAELAVEVLALSGKAMGSAELVYEGEGPVNTVRTTVDGPPTLHTNVTMQSAGHIREISSPLTFGSLRIERLSVARKSDTEAAVLVQLSGGGSHELLLRAAAAPGGKAASFGSPDGFVARLLALLTRLLPTKLALAPKPAPIARAFDDKLPAATVVVSAAAAFEKPDPSSKQVAVMTRHTPLTAVLDKKKVVSDWWYQVTFDLKGTPTTAWVAAADVSEIADPAAFTFLTPGSDGWTSPFEDLRSAVKSVKAEAKIARHINYLNLVVLPDATSLSEAVAKAFYHALVESKGDFKEACLIVTASVRAQKAASGGTFMWVQQRGPATKSYDFAGYRDKVWHMFFNAHQRLDGTSAKWLDVKGVLYELKSRSSPIQSLFTLKDLSRDAKEDILFNRGGVMLAEWLMKNRDAVTSHWGGVVKKGFEDAIETDPEMKKLDAATKQKLIEKVLQEDDVVREVQKNSWADFAEAAGKAVGLVLDAAKKI